MQRTIILFFLSIQSALAVLTVTFPNANVYTSPYSCQIVSGNLISPTSGCYIKGTVSGTTSISFNVDTTVNSGQSANGMPAFRVTIDDGASTYIQEGTSDTTETLASGLTTASHNYLIQFLGPADNVGNQWTGTLGQTKVTAIVFDTGASLSAQLTRPNVCLFFGDSYLAAYYGATQTGAFYTYVDFTTSYPRWVASALNCEYGQIGIGSQGWKNTGNASVPAFPSSWDHYDSTHARDLTTIPNYLIVAQGNNDHVGTWSTGQIDAAVTGWLTAMRATTGWAAVPTYVLKPFSDASDAANHTQIASSVVAYANSNSDVHLYSIDIGSEYQGCLPFSAGTTWCSTDGIHPLAVYHGAIGAMIVDKILSATPTPSPVTLRRGLILR